MRTRTLAAIIVFGIIILGAAGCATCHGTKGAGQEAELAKAPQAEVLAPAGKAAEAKPAAPAEKPAEAAPAAPAEKAAEAKSAETGAAQPPAKAPEAFPGYKPKDTPDTVLDYRPKLREQLDSLPAPHIPSLPTLVKLLEKTKKDAEKNPGKWTEGRVMLGANAKEYVPSDDELVAAEIGDRVEKVVKHPGWTTQIRTVLNMAAVKVGSVTFKRFGFRHSDVMGSGRFFYVTGPDEVTVDLPR
jgi:hypothetical protein